MHPKILFLTGLIGLCSAQVTTTLLLPQLNVETVLASIVGSEIHATTYVLACPPESFTHQASCNVESLTIAEGPGTVYYSQSASNFYNTVNCSLTGTTQAYCSGTAIFDNSGIPSTTSNALLLAGTELASLYHVVTLTNSLPGATTTLSASGVSSSVSQTTGSDSMTTTAGDASQSTNMASQKPTASSSSITSQSASSTDNSTGSSTSSGTAASKTSSAGMSKATAIAGWAIGGVALAMVGVGY